MTMKGEINQNRSKVNQEKGSNQHEMKEHSFELILERIIQQ